MRFINLSSEMERQRIVNALNDWEKPKEIRRVRAVRMSTKGFTVPQIAEALDVCRWSVREWFNWYEENGIESLKTNPRPGAPRKADQEYMDILGKTVQEDPRKLGYSFSCWTREYLARHMEKQTGVEISSSHMSTLLKELDFTYKRPKHDLSHKRDPELYEAKKRELVGLKKKPDAKSHNLN